MMRQTMAVPIASSNRGNWLQQIIIAIVGGFFLFIMGLSITLVFFGIQYRGKIFPGIQVAGIDLSGQTLTQAIQTLQTQITFPELGEIVLQDGQKVWQIHPKDLGFHIDVERTAIAAYNLGRANGIWGRLQALNFALHKNGYLSPILIYDERTAQAYLNSLAQHINTPVMDAKLNINGNQVEAVPGQVGRTLDIEKSLQAIQTQILTLTDGIVPLVIKEEKPPILDVSQSAELARKILSSPLTLSLPDRDEGDPPNWQIEADELSRMLVIERVNQANSSSYQISLRETSLRSILQKIAKQIDRQPQNARFIFNDETRQLELIQPALIGRTLDIAATLKAIEEQVPQGKHTLNLIINTAQPAVGNDATAEKLGIRELVSKYTSYFYGSSAARIQNIQTAAARFHGVLVAPGETFSMASVLGDVSLDNGYAEALIIYGDRTIKGVGGGVCQVSTTLFRTAFFGGYPIVERHPHAYRVTYYEQTRTGAIDPQLAGLDATVFVPVVDFKFTNDTPYWLLMETYINVSARTLTWKFYSTSDGRTVEWKTSGLQNIVEPGDPILQENPDLGTNEFKQVDWAVEGADVTVTRTVYKDGQIYFTDQFITHYMPWQAVYEYGPGTNMKKLLQWIAQQQ
ncbi:MAG: VanW family protein [Anaerolineales bacterium]